VRARAHGRGGRAPPLRAGRAGAARARDGRAGRRTARRPLPTRLPGARLRHRAPRRLDRPRGARRGRARRGRRRRSRVRARAGPRAHRGDRAREGAVMAEPPATPRFEDALAELEGLVQRLEKGELPLEESLAVFERGIGLVRSLGQRLADDDLRRGQPTSHKVWGEGLAILVGDALLTEAFRVMAGARGVPPARALGAVAEVAAAAGEAGMVGGQALDLAAEGSRPSLRRVQDIHRRKTGALLRSAVRVGALVAGADARTLRRLTAYGEHLGL